jgi:hypothetical protein
MSMMTLIAVVGATFAIAVRVLVSSSGRPFALRVARSDIAETIASMPAELQDDWGEEWLAELEAVVAKPMTALSFAFGLRLAARRLCAESGLDKPARRRRRRVSMSASPR